jgi:hypothetical protein
MANVSQSDVENELRWLVLFFDALFSAILLPHFNVSFFFSLLNCGLSIVCRPQRWRISSYARVNNVSIPVAAWKVHIPEVCHVPRCLWMEAPCLRQAQTRTCKTSVTSSMMTRFMPLYTAVYYSLSSIPSRSKRLLNFLNRFMCHSLFVFVIFIGWESLEYDYHSNSWFGMGSALWKKYPT